MPIVQSFGALQSFPPGASAVATAPRASGLDHLAAASYAQFYRSQPNIRTVVDFIARNIAQLGIHAFRRVSDLDRERLADHEILGWLARPNPGTVQYRLIENLLQDLGIYFNAYWLKVRLEDRLGLMRLSPEDVYPVGWLLPKAFHWTLPDGRVQPLARRDVVHFNGFDPCNPLEGLSPIETLKSILSENASANIYRRAFWQNAARLEGVITRPAGAPKWTPEQKLSWREQWQARYAGQPGQVAVLEDGMTFSPMSSTAIDAELSVSRKLTREECAAAYHVPLPMVGILDHATFSNVKEQHKQLYQDCLGPWLMWIQQELQAQLLVECDDQEDVYLEFNFAEKLKGSFEEQAASLQTLVGRPVMTVNEGRARLNLPSIKDDASADAVATPLNMTAGTAPKPDAVTLATDATAPVIRAMWSRQRDRLDKVDRTERAAAFDVGRWDRDLTHALEPLYRAAGADEGSAARQASALATTINAETLQLLVAGEEAFSSAREAALYVDSTPTL